MTPEWAALLDLEWRHQLARLSPSERARVLAWLERWGVSACRFVFMFHDAVASGLLARGATMAPMEQPHGD